MKKLLLFSLLIIGTTNLCLAPPKANKRGCWSQCKGCIRGADKTGAAARVLFLLESVLDEVETVDLLGDYLSRFKGF